MLDIFVVVKLHHHKQLLLYPAVLYVCGPGLTLRGLLCDCAALLLHSVCVRFGVWYIIHQPPRESSIWNSMDVHLV